jgi:hypothetical protein
MASTMWRHWVIAAAAWMLAVGCSGPSTDDFDLEDADRNALTWVAPLTDATIEAGDAVEFALATQNPGARVVRFLVDGTEIAVCEPSQPEEDCHVDDLWRWTTTFDAAGHHTIEARFATADGTVVRATRDIEVLPAGSAPAPIDEEAPENGVDIVPDNELVDEGSSMFVDAISSRRGFLDPNRGFHNVFGGISWAVQSQRVLFHRGRLDGSVSAVSGCMARYGNSIRRYGDLYHISRASIVATAITESNCTNPRGSSDGLSSGPMQVTASTCAAMTRLSRSTCRRRMHENPDFSFEVGVRYMASSYQRRQHRNDPPKIAAAYNAGSIRRSRANRWHMVVTGNHIDRFVAAYNAYRTWERRQGIALEFAPAQVSFEGEHVTTPSALPATAPDGRSYFVGDWSRRDGEFYMYFNGQWLSNAE